MTGRVQGVRPVCAGLASESPQTLPRWRKTAKAGAPGVSPETPALYNHLPIQSGGQMLCAGHSCGAPIPSAVRG